MAENWDDDGWNDTYEPPQEYVHPFIDEDSNTVKIDSSKVGQVIGSRGSTIKELQEDSGANIKIGKIEGGYTFIYLKGRRDQIENAKRQIHEVVTGNRPRISRKEREWNNAYSEKIIDLRATKAKGLQRQDKRHLVENVKREANVDIFFGDVSEYGDTMEVVIKGKNPAIDKAIQMINKIDLGRHIDPEPTMEELMALSDRKERDKWAREPKIIKNVYKEDPEVANMTPEQVEAFRKKNNDISVSVVTSDGQIDENPDFQIPNPVTSFKQAFQHYPEILRQLENLSFTTPSPIQAQAWPILMSGHDMIGIAQTGTGKTFAFLLPALIHTHLQTTPISERAGPSVLVMAPTRELATQIEREVNKIDYKGLKAVCVYGGKELEPQLEKIREGCHILIATPGRLNDFVSRASIDLKAVSFVVLDEADRMLDLGFEPQINKTSIYINPNRQTVMTSATWNKDVQRVAKKYMVNPVKVNVGSLDLAATHTVTQKIIILDEDEKKDWLMEFFDNMDEERDKVMVFMGRKASVSAMSSDLACQYRKSCSLYGDLSQEDREIALEDITSGYARICVATDVASRGLDVPDLTHVINYDFPSHIEEYVHRVGRTGRAGKSGESITLMTRKDWSHAHEIIPILEEGGHELNLLMLNQWDQAKLQ
ncbi:DEAD-box ATP-dependent RNA helicase 20-like [Diaphorina citri]|uniref:RNA helicase n=1 Tax=Diaphorina citri TaxID=121845 RepID=A0A3Q0J8F2_DIACI|nr:DEAD-box ATP-dependent RNA helicase 20-like [Diaphorina citri]